MSLEKELLKGIEPFIEEQVAIAAELRQLAERTGAGIKSIEPAEGCLLIKLTDGQECRFELPVGPAGEPGRDGRDGKDGVGVSAEEVCDNLKSDEWFIRSLKGEVGEKGEPGERGEKGEAGEKGESADPEVVADLVKQDEEFVRLVKGEKGDAGEAGRDGQDGKDADPHEVAAIIKVDPEFKEQVRGEKGETGEKGDAGRDGAGIDLKVWTPGIYRKDTFVQHNIGQVFLSLKDTTDEPGTSEDWVRFGTFGFRHTGVKKKDFEYQPGDFYIDGGTTFMWWNGKGNMFAGRGRDGKDGKDGKDGRDGKDGAGILDLVETKDGFAIVMEDGETKQLAFQQLTEFQKALTWLEEQLTSLPDDTEAPIKRFAGIFKMGEDYKVGDTVKFNSSLYLCIESDSNSTGMNPENWIKLAGGGSGGGGGGGSISGWPSPVTSNLNMSGYSITNVSVGTTPGSLATKGYVDNRTPPVFVLADSAALAAKAGASVSDKLTATASGAPTAGTRIFVGFSAAPGADNSNAGLWVYNGVNWQQTILGSSGGGGVGSSTIKTGTAAALSAYDPSPIAALTAGFNAMFGTAPAAGEMVLISGGSGSVAVYNGTYVYDGTSWHLISTDLTGFINGGVKALAADADPLTTTWPTGSVMTTLETGKREIRVKNAAGTLQTVYSESDVLTQIAASRTFKGTAVESGTTRVGSVSTDAMKAESALVAADLGSYWVYVGAAGHTIAANDMGGAVSAIDGLVLQSGDWIMVANTAAAGTTPVYQYVLIHGDSLGRAQADGLFGHNVWTAGAHEVGTIVRYQASPTSPLKYYKASSAIVPADPAPGVTTPSTLPADYGLALNFEMPAGLADGTLIHFVMTRDGVGTPVTFDYTTVAGDSVAATLATNVQTAMVADPLITAWGTPSVSGGTGVTVTTTTAAFSATADNGVVVSVVTPPPPTASKWIDITPTHSIGDISDVDMTTVAPTAGDALVYNGGTGKWEPHQVGQPMVFYGSGAFDSSNVDAAHNWGMPAGTRPDPVQWPPTAGDLYINTLTGIIVQFSGGGSTNPTRRGGPATGGTASALDVILENLGDINNVDLLTNTPVDGEALTYDATSQMWVPGTIPNAYTKAEVDTRLQAIVTGLSHDVAVIDYRTSPPAAPVVDEFYIVKATATGAWAGHDNEIAYWDGTAWVFTAPQLNEAHLNEADNFIYHWNGSAWNKVASGNVSTLASLTDVDVTRGINDGDMLVYHTAGAAFRAQAPVATVAMGADRPSVGSYAEGAMVLDTTKNRLAVKVNGQWRELGRTWRIGENAGQIEIPGYFGHAPDDTHAPADIIGLAAQYYGGTIQLFGHKGSEWHPLSPWVGDAANAGKVVIADAAGDPTWGDFPGTHWTASKDMINNTSGIIDITAGTALVSVINLEFAFIPNGTSADAGVKFLIDGTEEGNAYDLSVAGNWKSGCNATTNWAASSSSTFSSGYRGNDMHTQHRFATNALAFNYIPDANIRFRANAAHLVSMKLIHAGGGNTMFTWNSYYVCNDLTPVTVQGTLWLNLDMTRIKGLWFGTSGPTMQMGHVQATALKTI